MVRALLKVLGESVGLPAYLAKSLRSIKGELQYAQLSVSICIFFNFKTKGSIVDPNKFGLPRKDSIWLR